MTRVYSSEARALCFYHRKADEQFWDEQWNNVRYSKTYESPPNSTYVTNETVKWLPEGSRILEGGCGTGKHVYALDKQGFVATGLDFAEKTVARANEIWPHLDVQHGDVFSLPFDDESFDGYWSLGVIEHFVGGFDGIIQEAHRVLRPGGMLFVTFPFMSMLRKAKAAVRVYPRIDVPTSKYAEDEFYQFALPVGKVVERASALGFAIQSRRGCDAIIGLRREGPWPVNALAYRIGSNKLIGAKVLKPLIESLLAGVCGHKALLVFKKLAVN